VGNPEPWDVDLKVFSLAAQTLQSFNSSFTITKKSIEIELKLLGSM